MFRFKVFGGSVIPAVAIIALGAVHVANARPGICDRTAQQLFKACQHDATHSARVAYAVCLNIKDSSEAESCFRQTAADRHQAFDECDDVDGSRQEVCDALPG